MAHVCVSLTCIVEHVPPHDGGVMERERVCEPPPHVVLQADHADQTPMLQSTGQQLKLHGCVCDVCDSLHEPPQTAAVMERERDCAPPPQVTEQADHVDQAPTMQLAGQQAGMHDCDSCSALASGQLPPFIAAVTMVRVRVAVPVPQVTEHDHELQAET
jgi:hypothetical protein